MPPKRKAIPKVTAIEGKNEKKKGVTKSQETPSKRSKRSASDIEEPAVKRAKTEPKTFMNKTDTDLNETNFDCEKLNAEGNKYNLKIVSWNVSGIRALIKKSGMQYIMKENADIVSLQETKCDKNKLPEEVKLKGYHYYFHDSKKPGYCGVALYTKQKPMNVEYGLNNSEFDDEGRLITAEYPNFYLLNVYVPNAGQKLVTLPKRLQWNEVFKNYVKQLDEKKLVIICGDMNVAHEEIDIANPKTNVKNAGFTKEEREGMTDFLAQGFVDTFRFLYPDKAGVYTFWSYFANARSKNIGWRLDYFLVSERIKNKVCDNVIRDKLKMTSVTRNIIKLHKYESFVYFFLWTNAILYSIYKVSLISTYFDNYNDVYGDFTPGWSWIGKKQDVSDQEWKIWIPLMIKLIPWIFIHHLVSLIIKTVSNITLLCSWYTFMSISFLHSLIGTLGTLCIFIQLSVLYILTYKQSRLFIWLINMLFLFLIHFLKIPDGTFQSTFKFNDEEHYLLTLIMCWIQLRSISYSIDNMNKHLKSDCDEMLYFFNNFLYKLAYCLYLPTLSLGPLILYHDFMDSIKETFQFWKLEDFGNIFFRIIKYIFWIVFTNLCLHFLYFNVMQYHPEVVEIVNPWALYGLGYCMGQFFLMKYVVVYGLNHTLCAIDNIEAPSQPKCIARIHLYSDMWKYFDKGLYKFLIRYIYVPLLKSNYNKLFASFLCFTFVFVWHGMQINIFIWAALNFIGLNIESVMKSFGRQKYYLSIKKKYLSQINARRFDCILASPLLAVSVISNFYFFAGEEIGNIYVYRLLHDPWSTTFTLLFFLYCCCQVSTDIKNWELQKCQNIL